MGLYGRNRYLLTSFAAIQKYIEKTHNKIFINWKSTESRLNKVLRGPLYEKTKESVMENRYSTHKENFKVYTFTRVKRNDEKSRILSFPKWRVFEHLMNK